MITASAAPSPRPAAYQVDVELFAFVERYVTNLLRWDLLLFFGGHPDRKLTARELARRMGRTVKATTKELDDLTYLHVLLRRYTPERVTYQLARSGPSRRSVKRLADYAGQGKKKDA